VAATAPAGCCCYCQYLLRKLHLLRCCYLRPQQLLLRLPLVLLLLL
jgi:hypothetical protein